MFVFELSLKHMLSKFKRLYVHNDKQKEAWMRFCHALSVACIVGTVTVLFTEYEFSWLVASRIVSLSFGAVVFLFGGLTFGRKL